MKLERSHWVWYGLIFAAVFSLYSVSIGHDFLFDEESIILNNPTIKDLSLIPQLFQKSYFFVQGRTQDLWVLRYRPVASLTFALDYYFWKGDPFGYNLTNTLLHALVSLLFFKLLLLIFKDRVTAFLCALLYSVHPIHTEAVTTIASRGDLLAGLGALAVMIGYWKGWTAAALFFYALALFSKENAILIPLFLIFLDIAFIKSGVRKLFLKLAPFLAVMFLYFVYRKYFCPIPLGPSSLDAREGFLRFLSMGYGFLDYLYALVLPGNFTLYREINFATDFSAFQVKITVLIIFLLVASWALALKYRGAAFFGLSLFFISLAPSLQIIRYQPEWAEHYLYIPAMGLAVLLGCIFRECLKAKRKIAVVFLAAVYSVFAFFLCYRTWDRNQVYNSKEKFYTLLTESTSPNIFFGYLNLGYLEMAKENMSQAKFYFNAALSARPDQPFIYHALAFYAAKEERFDEAITHLKKALSLDEDDNSKRLALGNVFVKMGRYREAIAILEEAQKRNPTYYNLYPRLMNACELNQDPEAAAAWAEQGLRHAEGNPLESAKILMEELRLAYRQGDDAKARGVLAALLDRYRNVPWYYDAARLLAGQISAEQFLSMAQTKYPGFETSADRYVLMSFVLGGHPESAQTFYQAHKTEFDDLLKGQPLFQKELARAGIHEN